MAGGGASAPDELGNGHQLITAVFQPFHNGVYSRHRGGVDVMHQDDGAGLGAVYGAGGRQSFVSTSHMMVVKPKRWRAQEATPAFV